MGKELKRLFKAFKKIRPVPVAMTVCLLVAAYSFWLPVIRVIASPFGSAAWSVSDIVKTIPKSVSQPAKKPGFKIDYDFADLVMKIIPKDSQSQIPKKWSYTFIYLMLVPVAYAAAYFGIVLQFAMMFFSRGPALRQTAGVTVVSAFYALFGTYYLGIQAKLVFADAVDRASKGTFGFVSKYFVGQVAVSADTGVYVLFLASVLAFIISFFWKTHRRNKN